MNMLPYNGAVECSCSILIKNATQKCNDKQIMQSIWLILFGILGWKKPNIENNLSNLGTKATNRGHKTNKCGWTHEPKYFSFQTAHEPATIASANIQVVGIDNSTIQPIIKSSLLFEFLFYWNKIWDEWTFPLF